MPDVLNDYHVTSLTSRSYQFDASNRGVLDGSGVSSSVYVLTRIRWLNVSESKLYTTYNGHQHDHALCHSNNGIQPLINDTTINSKQNLQLQDSEKPANYKWHCLNHTIWTAAL